MRRQSVRPAASPQRDANALISETGFSSTNEYGLVPEMHPRRAVNLRTASLYRTIPSSDLHLKGGNGTVRPVTASLAAGVSACCILFLRIIRRIENCVRTSRSAPSGIGRPFVPKIGRVDDDGARVADDIRQLVLPIRLRCDQLAARVEMGVRLPRPRKSRTVRDSRERGAV